MIQIADSAGVRVEVLDAVATVTLSRPQRHNAQDPVMWEALREIARSLPATVRVVVLRGEGASFSSGLDRRLLTDRGPDGVLGLADLSAAEATARIGRWQEAFAWSRRADLISVALVQGHAIGAGFQLALSADVRIVADDVRFAMAEPRLGLVPDLGGTKRLVELIGYSHAADLCLTTRPVGAAEAVTMGLASRAVAVAELDVAGEQYVAALLAVDRDAAIETKALLLAATGRTQDEQQAAEREAQYRRMRALAGRTDD